MLYKTIVLEMLQQRPALHERLRQRRTLLPTLGRLALDLKACHQTVQAQLAQAMPQQAPQALAQQALEIALEELKASLPGA